MKRSPLPRLSTTKAAKLLTADTEAAGVVALLPLMSKAEPGAVVLIPTLELVVSISNTPELTLKAVVDEVRVSPALPAVLVRERVPVVKVRPLEAVSVEENLPVPVTSRVVPGILLPIPTFPFCVMTNFVSPEEEAAIISCVSYWSNIAIALPLATEPEVGVLKSN